MRWLVRTVLGALGLPGDLDTLFTMLGLSGGAAVVTAYIAHILGEHGHWIIVAAVAVFTFTVMSIYYILLVKRQISVFGDLVMDQISVKGAAALGFEPPPPQKKNKPPPLAPAKKISHLTIECLLRNNSERTIFFKIRRESHSMEGKINTNTPTFDQVFVVPARLTAPLFLATLPEFEITPPNAPKGYVDLEILYGPSEETLRYLFRYEGEMQLAVSHDQKTGQIMLTMITAIKKYKHERLGWFS